VRVFRVREKAESRGEKRYLEITTEEGVSGLGGDLFQQQPRRLEELSGKLGKLLVGRDPRDRKLDSEWLWRQLYPEHDLEDYAKGRDPLTGKSIWGTRRGSRHTPTGSVVMALSAVDNALWDLRGKLAGRPVYRLLGGRRDRLPAYVSVMPPDSLKDVRQRARQLFSAGFTSQKWFLTKGPPDGDKGFRSNVGQVEALRTELGPEARLMFDFAVGQRGRCDWDVPYAISFAKAVEPFKPYWLEEPFSPEEIKAYERLRGETEIPLATGEHTYTRWNIRPFLERNLIRFVQSDPEWCGGISELLRICRLVQQYDGVCLIPHGHHVLAAAHVVASQPQDLCPMVEYGVGWIPGRQRLQIRRVTPEKGYLHLPEEPGLGPDLDWKRLERL
jgi:L-alanine-DL-glutamate epimerase-like enolase superfamily enzyme